MPEGAVKCTSEADDFRIYGSQSDANSPPVIYTALIIRTSRRIIKGDI